MPLIRAGHPPLARRVWLGLAVATMTAGVAQAQGRVRATPSVSTTEEYDTNVFASSLDPQADFLTRASMGLEVEYTTPRWITSTRYLHDVERFANHPRLSSADARQRAAVAFGYQPTARTTWGADAEFWKTRTPGELNESTGLTLARASAWRAAAHSSVRHRLNQLTSGTIDYAITQDHLAGRAESTTHDASAGVEQRRSSRAVLRLDYRFRQFVFKNPDPTAAFAATSHAMTLGWTRSMTPRWRFAIDGGPRMTNTSLRPELSASVHYQPMTGELSVTYARTQATVIGLANVAESQSVAVALSRPLWSSIHLRLAPTLFRTEVDRSHADAWVLAIDLTRSITRGLALDLAVDASMQRGGLSLSQANATIARQVVLLRLVAGSSSFLR